MANGTILQFTGLTKGTIDPRTVAAGAAELETLLVLGWDKNGQFYIASSIGELADLLVLIELGKREVMEAIEP